MRRQIYVMLLVACSHARDPNAIAAAHQPQLDALVARVNALKQKLHGPNWQTLVRMAPLANDELGLPPFEQTTPPGPGWHASPATLLGIADYVRGLDLHGDDLRHLADDEQQRYDAGIHDVDARLRELELRVE
jgi:hypothetical protein